MPIPDHMKEAFEIINQARAKRNRPAFLWSDKLAAAAQEHSNWLHTSYLNKDCDVGQEAHHDLQGRLERAGYLTPGEIWADVASECGAMGSTACTGEDGIRYEPTESGYCYPYRSVKTCVNETVQAILLDPYCLENPHEGHCKDAASFKWKYIGLGWQGGFFIIEYGVRP